MKKFLVLGCALAASSFAHASFTVATFADPSTNKANWIFLWDQVANTLSGGWHQGGMTVRTPGLIGGGQVNNAQMDFDSVALTPIIAGQLYRMSAGRVRFHTGDLTNSFLTITFDSGLFQTPLAIGGSNLFADNVRFSGPNVPGGLSEEQFSFSLANENNVANGKTFTSAFTSSATPEPATLLVLGGGVLLAVRRRRQR
ncbi:MAG: PEP-CTERM sorting domain-containing protein [Chthonomonadaceae bacterium]|jgi:hypothetical protein|nr:PEP-CTERM sorting domain-containing protein [Chthonomonadaceae bacterium]